MPDTTRAFMDLKLVIKPTDEPVKDEDPTWQYRFEGFKADATRSHDSHALDRFHLQNGSVTARDRDGRASVDIRTVLLDKFECSGVLK